MKNTIERALAKQQKLEAEKRASNSASTTVNNAKVPPAPSQPTPQNDPQLRVETPLVQSHQQTETEAPAKPAIEVNIRDLTDLGMITPDEDFSQIKEEYRYIKRPLLNNAFGEHAGNIKNSNLIMVSSSFPGEGKTFTAINLAISFALEQDRKVLLVDADVINPHVCKRLNIKERTGLLDYLRGSCKVTDIINDTNIPNLKLITAGSKSHHSTELLASEKMLTLMRELSTRYNDRIVVFDTAPILGASETGVLSQMIGQAVVVVEEERTTHGQLERALSQLDQNTAVGLVLNKSKKSRKEYYGYYYANRK